MKKETQIQRGDMFQLGEHRLLCGDATKKEDVEELMNGEKADIIITDPPYNIGGKSRNYAADFRTMKKTYAVLKEANWDQDFNIKIALNQMDNIIANDCAVYIFSSHFLISEIWEWMAKWSDYYFYNVWCKPNPTPSLSKRHWTWATELVAYGVRGKHICNFPEHGHALNWWKINKTQHYNGHPTEKPLEVIMYPMEFSSKEGAICYDGFSGSGTTLVACENLKRKCRAIDIDPLYCQVIIDRWEKLTGKKAEKI
jgi:DNA modification methylase